MRCPSCGEEAPADAKWCEACGQDLNSEPLPACVSCGEREVAGEGYCLSCGHKQPAERDHMEFEDGPASAVTDRGRRHRHNEDAVAIAATPDGGSVLVVCDGVSSTAGSAEASLRAAVAARDLLLAGLTGHPRSDGAGPATSEPTVGPGGSAGSDVAVPPDARPETMVETWPEAAAATQSEAQPETSSDIRSGTGSVVDGPNETDGAAGPACDATVRSEPTVGGGPDMRSTPRCSCGGRCRWLKPRHRRRPTARCRITTTSEARHLPPSWR